VRTRLQAIGEARIELAVIAQGGPDAAAPAPAAAAGRSGVPARVLAAAIALTVLATYATVRLFVHAPAGRTLRLSVLAPEGVVVTNEVPEVVLSPDGATIAFVGRDTSGVSHVWLRPLAANTARILPGTEGAQVPFWSPDSRELGFFADGSLKRVPVDGEGVQTLTAGATARGAAWSRRGVIVFAPNASGPLMQVPASGGDPKPATTLDAARGESAHRFPCFLPDGRHFLYVVLPGKDSRLETRVGSLDGRSSPTVVTASSGAVYAAPGYLVYNRDGTIVAQPFDARALRTTGAARPIRDLEDVTGSYTGSPVVSVSDEGVLLQREAESIDVRLDVLDRAGRTTSTLSLPPANYVFPRLSPDGSHLVLDRSKRGEIITPLWMVDMVRGTASRFTFDGQFDTAPVWTPDGQWVVYGSDRTGGRQIFRKRADGSGTEELVAKVPNLFNDPFDVSPDGRLLVYRSLSGATAEDVWLLPLVGERKPRPLLDSRFNELDATLSPDGKWIAYRTDESGRYEIVVQSFPALNRKLRVSTSGASPTARNSLSRVRWRRDGRELLYIGGDGETLMSADVTPGDDIRFGTPRPLLRMPAGALDLDIAADGQHVIACMPAGAHGRTVLNLLLNWERELRAAR
jgi:Tol biopolymer transport system component